MSPAEKSIAYMNLLRQKYNRKNRFIIQYVSRDVCSAGQRDDADLYKVSIERIAEETQYGFLEYPTVRYLWAGYEPFRLYIYKDEPTRYRKASNIVGDKAIWALTLHEFAHIIQYDSDFDYTDQKRRNGKIVRVFDLHGKKFQDILARLIRENPYRENFWTPVVESWERFL